jgi:hypothetical protein
MQCNGKYFICPSSQNDPAKEVEHPNCFVIKKQVAIEMLTNPRHSANIFLSSHERESLGEAIHSF